ncbi:HesA/MoeB/ThiF family protein [Flavobacterium sp.]|uniref:HesA/MoeB/ThiF family protein n=1 Tax=Flavobacterium sp. TaxID=239 RepID=UPI0011FE5101|nr:HesA/MoeB/ThiF family protein [Flavobacterium sp.]RZJ73027.1 MAG: hypothetical protein EOO49_05190 [Flavobacterium sp.]
MMNRNPRYERHYVLKNFGVSAQQKLGGASVLVVGAGGLGCPVLQYLAAAGVGKIGISDGDSVALSNLQRQVLFVTSDVGKPKAKIASERLKNLNPEIEILEFGFHIDNKNAMEIFPKFDIIVDCTDNFASRYLINDACVLLDKPLVFGAIFRYEGQVAVFNLSGETGRKTNYRDLFPIPPNANEAQDCNEAGVLGVLPGTIGTLMANETIKIITGLGSDLRNKLFTINVLDYQNYTLEISPNPKAKVPENVNAFLETDYEWLCGNKIEGIAGIFAEDLLDYLKSDGILAIDVRENHELPKADFAHERFPLSELKNELPDIDSRNIVVFCQSGKRSLEAAKLLRESLPTNTKIAHLKGGIIALQEFLHGKTS